MAPSEQLGRYRAKRDFAQTAEPAGEAAIKPAVDPTAVRGDPGPRFVVQEHHATRLHWDLRLEHEGVLASWALPAGVPPDPSENRLAVRTEDHPLQYLEFEGEIPKGQYGAGTMRIWDRGTFELHKWEPSKVEVSFHGERLRGRYGLFPLGPARAGERAPHAGEGDHTGDWMIHRMDRPSDPDRVPMPERVVPMLACAGKLPGDDLDWCFEVKWDGIRAIAYLQPGRLRLESRNLLDITDAYPELRGLAGQLGMRDAVLDGEIVAFDDAGRPSFERLQRRMHVRSPAAVRRLAASTPVVYAIFDLLYLEGRSLLAAPHHERRARLQALELGGVAWRVPEEHAGAGVGAALLEATREQGLEGIVAKRRDSRYDPGRRSRAWIKVKHTHRQELVIGGWIPGDGRRAERIGALLVGCWEGSAFRYAGRVGTGFTEASLDDLTARLAPLRREQSAFADGPKLPPGTIFVQPHLVAEIEFAQWTAERVMRAPSFKGLRTDKAPREVVIEAPDGERVIVGEDAPVGEAAPAGEPAPAGDPGLPEALFDDVRPLADGGLVVLVDGRELKLTNWDKVLFPATGFTKGQLIGYYARIAPTVLAHLRGRPLTLKRYPNGVDGEYFYEKNAPSHRPEWIHTASVGGLRYVLAQDRATLIWLANLADIELHTSLALAPAPQQPTMLVFDLDPGAPAGIIECCEVALVLRGLFDRLGIESVVKTSGSKGLQVYLPLNSAAGYEATKPFARRVAELLAAQVPDLVVSRMGKRLREGRVLVDWSQNDAHKTTVTVYSLRARSRATVSTPVSWEEVSRAHAAGDPSLLTFEHSDVLHRVDLLGDLFAPTLSLAQKLPALA